MNMALFTVLSYDVGSQEVQEALLRTSQDGTGTTQPDNRLYGGLAGKALAEAEDKLRF